MKWIIIGILSITGVVAFATINTNSDTENSNFSLSTDKPPAMKVSSTTSAPPKQTPKKKETMRRSEQSNKQRRRTNSQSLNGIDLTPEQASQYEQITSKYTKERKSLMLKRRQLSIEEYRQQYEQLKSSHNDELIAIMTDEQYQQYTNNLSSKRQAREQDQHSHSHNHRRAESKNPRTKPARDERSRP